MDAEFETFHIFLRQKQYFGVFFPTEKVIGGIPLGFSRLKKTVFLFEKKCVLV